MVSTLTHTIYGIMIALIFKLNIPLFVIFTNLPDLDGIVDVLTNKIRYHKYVFHNIFAFILTVVLGSIFFDFKLVFLALTLHFVLDTIDGYNGLFYPFLKKKIGLYLLKGKKKLLPNMWMYLFSDQNIYFTLVSYTIFIIVLLLYI